MHANTPMTLASTSNAGAVVLICAATGKYAPAVWITMSRDAGLSWRRLL